MYNSILKAISCFCYIFNISHLKTCFYTANFFYFPRTTDRIISNSECQDATVHNLLTMTNPIFFFFCIRRLCKKKTIIAFERRPMEQTNASSCFYLVKSTRGVSFYKLSRVYFTLCNALSIKKK